jgi:hypothetical protein
LTHALPPLVLLEIAAPPPSTLGPPSVLSAPGASGLSSVVAPSVAPEAD